MSLKKLLSIAISSGVLYLAAISGALAQAAGNSDTNTPLSQQALQELQDNRSLYSVGNGNLNVMQLIHNANLSGGKSPEEFRNGQNESLNDAAKEFRQQQRQQLGLPNNGVTVPNTINK